MEDEIKDEIIDVSKEVGDLIGDLPIDSKAVEPSPAAPSAPEETPPETPPEEPPEEPPQEPSKPEEPPETPPEPPPVQPSPAPPETPPETPPVPPAVEPPEPDEGSPEALQNTIDKLMARVEELTVINATKPPVDPPPQPDTPPPPAAVLPPVIELPPVTPEVPVDFIGDSSIDAIIDSKEKLNAVLNAVANQAAGRSQKETFERVLLAIPEIVTGHVQRQNVLGKLVKDFYDVNTDLVSVKGTVSAVANEIHASNPDWEIDKVFNESAHKTREVLGMKKLVVKPTEKKETPAFVTSSRGKIPVAPKVGGNSLQEQIDDLIN